MARMITNSCHKELETKLRHRTFCIEFRTIFVAILDMPRIVMPNDDITQNSLDDVPVGRLKASRSLAERSCPFPPP
jgi:hypothetical protein